MYSIVHFASYLHYNSALSTLSQCIIYRARIPPYAVIVISPTPIPAGLYLILSCPYLYCDQITVSYSWCSALLCGQLMFGTNLIFEQKTSVGKALRLI